MIYLTGDGFWNHPTVQQLGGFHSVTLLGDTIYVATDANVLKVRYLKLAWNARK